MPAKLKIPRLANKTIIPAIKTPKAIERMLFFLSKLRYQAIKLPVQAPVPGIGKATNNANARKP